MGPKARFLIVGDFLLVFPLIPKAGKVANLVKARKTE
jgi:hypothetical protein